jgi:hypothetical protein
MYVVVHFGFNHKRINKMSTVTLKHNEKEDDDGSIHSTDSRSPRPLQRRGPSASDLKIVNIPLRREDSSFFGGGVTSSVKIIIE